MNKNERLAIYWDLYFIAVGISTLMTPEQVDCNSYDHLPCGICSLLFEGWEIYKISSLFPELEKQWKCYLNDTYYWHTPGDWKPRAKDLLEAIKLCY